MSIKLGKIIKQQRVLRGFSQDDLAFEINVTQQYISLLEKGEKTPSVQTLNAIADALELDIDELVKAITM